MLWAETRKHAVEHGSAAPEASSPTNQHTQTTKCCTQHQGLKRCAVEGPNDSAGVYPLINIWWVCLVLLDLTLKIRSFWLVPSDPFLDRHVFLFHTTLLFLLSRLRRWTGCLGGVILQTSVSWSRVLVFPRGQFVNHSSIKCWWSEQDKQKSHFWITCLTLLLSLNWWICVCLYFMFLLNWMWDFIVHFWSFSLLHLKTVNAVFVRTGLTHSEILDFFCSFSDDAAFQT